MNVLDLFFMAIIVLSVVYSFARGMIREFFGLLALVAGAFVGLKAAGPGVAALSPNIATPAVAAMVAFLITFALTSLVFLFVGSLLAHAASALHLGFADRLVGAVFGFARGVLIVTVIVLLLAAFQSPGRSAIRSSRIAASVTELARWACRWLPPEAGEALSRRLAPPGIEAAWIPTSAPQPFAGRADG